MQHTSGDRFRAVLIGSVTSLILTVAVLAASALAAADTQAIGAHTHQLHGMVATAPSTGAATFTVATERYGDVTVRSLAGQRRVMDMLRARPTLPS